MKDYSKQTVIEMKKDDVIRFYDSKGNKVKTIGCSENDKGCKYTINPNEYVVCISGKKLIGLIIGEDCNYIHIPDPIKKIKPNCIHIINSIEYDVSNPSINRKGDHKDKFITGKYTYNNIKSILINDLLDSAGICYLYDYIRPSIIESYLGWHGGVYTDKEIGIVQRGDNWDESNKLIKFINDNDRDVIIPMYINSNYILAFTHINHLKSITLQIDSKEDEYGEYKEILSKMYPGVNIKYHEYDTDKKKKGKKKKK